MAIRADINIDWEVHPRIITISAPSTSISAQDLLDTLRSHEASTYAMDDAPIVDASGKESLGSGVYVGLTVILQDSLLAFEARTGPEYVQCNVSGGNLVAIEGDGVTFYDTPISPTAFTQVVVTASSSATQVELENQVLQDIADSIINYDLVGYMTHGTLGGITSRNAYNDVIHFDATSTFTGASFPIGLHHKPVNNIPDLLLLLEQYHFNKVFIMSDTTIPASSDISGINFVGHTSIDRHITIENGAKTRGTLFDNVTITGYLDGKIEVYNSIVENVYNLNGTISSSVISGFVTMGGISNKISLFDDCCSCNVLGVATITINDNYVNFPKWSGTIQLLNKTGISDTIMTIATGHVVVDPTCTAGSITISGDGYVTDNSDATCDVNYSQIKNITSISNNVWSHNTATGLISDVGTKSSQVSVDSIINYLPNLATTSRIDALNDISATDASNAVWSHTDAVQMLLDVDFIKNIEGGRWHISNNQMIFYADDNTTEIARFDLLDENGISAEKDVFQRLRQ